MNKIYIIFFIFILLSFNRRENYPNKIKKLLINEYKIDVKNGSVILINNGICNGLCGSHLNRFLIQKIKNNKDSIFFITTFDDNNLLDTLKHFSKIKIINSNFSTLNKYDIYESNHMAIKFQNFKPQQFTKIFKNTNFKNWNF
jgi:hypothetical protein